jgi:DNA/RNA-binding domain of Phe-tRNA-synthetase-like protein
MMVARPEAARTATTGRHMYFEHSDRIWSTYPELGASAVYVDGVAASVGVDAAVARLCAVAQERLAAGPAAGFPEIQAWRRAFARMGLKPTQYRCASEALLRRFAKERHLPRIHPLVDLCNAFSMAYAIPVAVFDLGKVTDALAVRHAEGGERYQSFGGETEHPEPNEVIFADPAGRYHARRWTNRQSGYSAVRDGTSEVLVVAEAMHDSARDDVRDLAANLADELAAHWSASPKIGTPTRSAPRFEF